MPDLESADILTYRCDDSGKFVRKARHAYGLHQF
jgi:hypothetical protein